MFLRRWTENTFGHFSLEQLMFHVSFGTQGVLTGDTTLIVDFLREVFLVPLAYAITAVAAIMLLGRLPGQRPDDGWKALLRAALPLLLLVFFLAGVARYAYRTAAVNAMPSVPSRLPLSKPFEYMVLQPGLLTLAAGLCLAAAAVIARFTPLPARANRMCSAVLSLRVWWAALAAALVYVASFFPANSYGQLFSTETAATYIDRAYVVPDYAPPKTPRSLVLIYVESLEASYRDIEGGRTLEPLDAETRDWPSLTGYRQVFGTGWTTAAVVSTQCGLPLRPPVGTFAERVEDDVSTHGAILARAACLGDLLARAGYDNVFLTGASLSFGGLGQFIWSHGYTRSLGREEWIRKGETEISEWGLTDDRLFARARAELDGLVAAKTPFNLTILTIDNHGPEGIINDACRGANVANFLDIVHCNAGLVADFIAYVRQRAPDAVVVVTGDHLVHENPFLPQLLALPRRHVYGKVLPPSGEGVWRTDVSHFDFFPSILEMLGFTSQSRRAGLGTSFVGPPLEGFVNPLTAPGYDDALEARSTLYTELWKPK